MNILNQIAIVIVTAVSTFLTRVTPFAVFGRKGQPPELVKYIGRILPPAVIAVLVVYCLKNMDLSNVSNFVPQLLGVAIVVLLHVWKGNNLLSIGGGTIGYMLMLQFIFKV